MPYSLASIPDLAGRTAVVTGANGGLGLEIAKALAGADARVVMAARNQVKAQSAADEILGVHPLASLELVELDLGSLDSIASAASTIAASCDRIDILVNNAGLMALPARKSADGFEMQLGVNHLGHWALTAQLMDNLLRADAARVVSQTSVAHHMSLGINADDPHLERGYGPWKAYNQSKLANYHFALGLQQEFERAGVAAISLMAHPGLTNSDLQSHTQAQGGAGLIGWSSEKLAKTTGMSTAAGALPAIRAATDPAAKGGEMYAPRFVTNGAPVRRPVIRPGGSKAIADLWAISERETGLKLDIPTRAH